jgi:hypothetical protein
MIQTQSDWITSDQTASKSNRAELLACTGRRLHLRAVFRLWKARPHKTDQYEQIDIITAVRERYKAQWIKASLTRYHERLSTQGYSHEHQAIGRRHSPRSG